MKAGYFALKQSCDEPQLQCTIDWQRRRSWLCSYAQVPHADVLLIFYHYPMATPQARGSRVRVPRHFAPGVLPLDERVAAVCVATNVRSRYDPILGLHLARLLSFVLRRLRFLFRNDNILKRIKQSQYYAGEEENSSRAAHKNCCGDFEKRVCVRS